jgi:uncharacterized protein (TIGR04255 family)
MQNQFGHKVEMPSFDSPPVIETVLSVQFEPIPAFKTIHFGLFWQQLRDEFPSVQDHSALQAVIEQPSDSSQGPKFRFEALDSLTPQRVWFVNNDGSELIQIQNDRFIKNWRMSPNGDEYPRYDACIRPAFDKHFQQFKEFVTKEGLGDIAINQCEVTYVNHIVAGEGWEKWSDFAEIFPWIQTRVGNKFPGLAEDLSLHSRHPIIDSDGKWIGRLHVEIQPSYRVTDMRPIYVMSLTARGLCGKEYDFLDYAHEMIVKSFVNLTSEKMHKIWGLE